MKLEGLVILAFYLQFGLQLLHQNFQPRNLYPQFLNVRCGPCGTRAGAWSCWWSLRSACVALLHECLGQSARPDVVCGRDSAGGGAVCAGAGGGTIRGAAGAENKLLNEGTAIGRSDGCCNAGAPWPIKFFTREINSCG